MRILLDEDVPVQVLPPLRHVLYGHTIQHVDELGWKGLRDPVVFQHARASGYDVFVTNNLKQRNVPEECTAIKRSGVHHVLYRHDVEGQQGLALAIAAIVAAMPRLIDELEEVSSQRLADITSIRNQKRYTITDPAHDPPSAYWP